MIMSVLPASVVAADNQNKKVETRTTKQERNHIRSGNALYREKRYAEAEVEYRKALQANPTSSLASFNLATALIRQGGKSTGDDKNDPIKQAAGLLQNVIKTSQDPLLQSKAFYDLGNIAYHSEQYDQAIECYKNALRRNPDDHEARYNLRMAQLKKQNQDKDKDQNQDKNQDQNQDQQNQDQNKDQQNQDKQNQDQQNQDKQNQNKQNQQQNPQQGLSNQSMEQIMKTMEDREQATQQRVNAAVERAQQAERAKTRNKW